MCDCHSYNWDIGTVPNVKLILPSSMKSSHKEIFVDACIADVIEHLWKCGVWTIASCCGHNKQKPNVVLSEAVELFYAQLAYEFIKEIDDREWEVYQWQLALVEPAENIE